MEACSIVGYRKGITCKRLESVVAVLIRCGDREKLLRSSREADGSRNRWAVRHRSRQCVDGERTVTKGTRLS